MRFFLDQNLGRPLAKGMSEFGEDVVHLTEYYDQDALDPDWLKDIGAKGWILVTRDERVRWNPAEIQAIREHKVGAFFLGGKNRSRCQLIQQLVKAWPNLKETAAKTRRPFAYKVRASGGKLLPIDLK